MFFEVRSGGLVGLVLISSNTRFLALALLGSAGKEVENTAILPPDGDIQLEERVYCGAPSFLSLGLRMKSLTENEKKYYETYQAPRQVHWSQQN